MNTSALDERNRDVLKSLIQLHIATGEPVGSESVARVMSRQVSSATIRNIMAELERLGYLDQPHTSAGRMPTDEGYRFYVDTLISHRPLAAPEAAAIESRLRPADSPAHVMQSASTLLSQLSHHVGFVLAPHLAQSTLRHIDLVRLPYPRILAVVVSGAGLVAHRVIELEEELTQDELQTCANYLNLNFAGMSLIAIRARLVELMQEEKALYDSLLKRAFAVGEQAFAVEPDGSDVYLEGASNILEQPEFEDVSRMREVFRTFEEKSRLVKILNACLGDGVRITIGRENPEPGLRTMAVVSAAYPVEGEPAWGVGVMGSTRMEYERMIALVDHVARAVSFALKDERP
jgi:heat-inducible transcriptional repressor